MREPAVSKVIKDALVTASWIQEVLAQRRTLLRWSSPQTCPGPWDEQRGLASRLQAKQVRRDLNERLSRTEGAERRAAVICLARCTKDRYTEELDLALSGSSGWTVTEIAALLTVLNGFEPRYGDDTWLSRVLDLAQDFDPQERETLRKPIEPLVRAIYDSPIEAARRRRLERLIARVLRTDPAPIPRSTLSLSDRWATTICDHLDRTPHLLPLIDHLCELRGPRPTKAWRVRCGELLRTTDARHLVRLALRAFDRDTEQIRRWGSTWRLVVSERNVDTARGFVWAAVLLGDDHAQGGGDGGAGRREVVQALVALAVRTSGVEQRIRSRAC
ncbi:hypothetical protein [Nonomuraea sp. NPDC046570]|uniref:hypothetical protein n=1 Tax=Nonomuraea sp. NPDC046570 TaxID=3155255 RepID=UPI0033D8195E